MNPNTCKDVAPEKTRKHFSEGIVRLYGEEGLWVRVDQHGTAHTFSHQSNSRQGAESLLFIAVALFN